MLKWSAVSAPMLFQGFLTKQLLLKVESYLLIKYLIEIMCNLHFLHVYDSNPGLIQDLCDIFAGKRSLLWCFYIAVPIDHPLKNNCDLFVLGFSIDEVHIWLAFDFSLCCSAVVAITACANYPLFPLFMPKQTAVAATRNIKRITFCAAKDFSCESPTRHREFRTANVKALIDWLRAESLLCCISRQQRAAKWKFIYMKMSWIITLKSSSSS